MALPALLTAVSLSRFLANPDNPPKLAPSCVAPFRQMRLRIYSHGLVVDKGLWIENPRILEESPADSSPRISQTQNF